VGGNAFIYRDFAHYTVNVLVRYPDFLEARGWLTSRITRWYRDQIPEISGIVRQHPEPWHIPDSDELDTLISDIGVLRKKIPVHNDTKYSYSATSCAIRFLRSIPATARNCFRYVNIFEDREAIAHFECHARGLIPFCRENKNLRIKRNVSLWTNLFPVHNAYYLRHHEDEVLHTKDVTKEVARWLVEAMELPSLGMPPGSFTMILDGDPLPS
jgi:hypothetical protein